jgi:hypothetical protein
MLRQNIDDNLGSSLPGLGIKHGELPGITKAHKKLNKAHIAEILYDKVQNRQYVRGFFFFFLRLRFVHGIH